MENIWLKFYYVNTQQNQDASPGTERPDKIFGFGKIHHPVENPVYRFNINESNAVCGKRFRIL